MYQNKHIWTIFFQKAHKTLSSTQKTDQARLSRKRREVQWKSILDHGLELPVGVRGVILWLELFSYCLLHRPSLFPFLFDLLYLLDHSWLPPTSCSCTHKTRSNQFILFLFKTLYTDSAFIIVLLLELNPSWRQYLKEYVAMWNRGTFCPSIFKDSTALKSRILRLAKLQSFNTTAMCLPQKVVLHDSRSTWEHSFNQVV